MEVFIPHAHRPSLSRRQLGMSLVELLVGITIGLFIVAAASLMVTSQLSDNRRLLLEVQVQQDLRATADVIARELRRAGGRKLAAEGVWSETNLASANPFSDITITGTPGNTEVRFDYERGIGLQRLGFRFDSARGVIQSYVGTGWQDLTDGNTMRVTGFTVQPPAPAIPAIPDPEIPCTKACPGGGTLCWPKLEVRAYVVEIIAEARTDDRIKRSLSSVVRRRNDAYSPVQECPA